MPSSASTAATRRYTAPAPWACSRPPREGPKAESPNASQPLHAPRTEPDSFGPFAQVKGSPFDSLHGDRLRRTGRSSRAAAANACGRPPAAAAPARRTAEDRSRAWKSPDVGQARGLSTLSGTDSALITASDVGSASVVAFRAQSARTRIRLPDMEYR